MSATDKTGAATAQSPAFGQWPRASKFRHATLMASAAGDELRVAADKKRVMLGAFAGADVGRWIDLSGAEASALGRELLKAAGAQDDAAALRAQRDELVTAAERALELIANATGSWAIDGADEMKLLQDALSGVSGGAAPATSAQPLSYDDALRIARGCTDYGGGYRGDPQKADAFQHGIQTVINALTAAGERGLQDSQIRVLHNIGAAGGDA